MSHGPIIIYMESDHLSNWLLDVEKNRKRKTYKIYYVVRCENVQMKNVYVYRFNANSFCFNEIEKRLIILKDFHRQLMHDFGWFVGQNLNFASIPPYFFQRFKAKLSFESNSQSNIWLDINETWNVQLWNMIACIDGANPTPFFHISFFQYIVLPP